MEENSKKEIKLSEAIREAANNKEIKQGNGAFYYFENENGDCISNLAGFDHNYQLCACALGAALYQVDKDAIYKKQDIMFRVGYINELIDKHFRNARKQLWMKDIKPLIEQLKNKDVRLFCSEIEHYGKISLAFFLAILNDRFKFTFNEIADMLDVIGY